jgi:adenine deaminase
VRGTSEKESGTSSDHGTISKEDVVERDQNGMLINTRQDSDTALSSQFHETLFEVVQSFDITQWVIVDNARTLDDVACHTHEYSLGCKL